jgi:hypothetical protein
MDEWSDDEVYKSPIRIEDIPEMNNFSAFLFFEDNSLKINKVLGKITYNNNNNLYQANHSIDFPKIIYKKNIYKNITDWINFIKKN